MFSRFLRSHKRKPRRRCRRKSVDTQLQQVENLEARTLLSNVTVELTPTQDGTLYENSQGAKANGAGSFLIVGPNANASRRAVVQFDISGTVPEGAVITEVRLTMHNSGGVENSRNVFLHPVTKPWSTGASDASGGEYSGANSGPGDVTWQHSLFADEFWSSPGGDFAGRSATTKVGSNGYYEWSSEGMIADVQQWLDAPESNNGWLLKSNESTKSVKRFGSSEHTRADRRPVLEITYEAPSFSGRIEGRKWFDRDVDGVKDHGEEWLDGWTIELYDVETGELIETQVTDSIDENESGAIDPQSEVGLYSFEVSPGTYEVREVLQPGWSQTYPGFSADFGKKDGQSASGGMTLYDDILHFDFDVDNPRNSGSLQLEFYVPNGRGKLRRVVNRPSQALQGEGRVVGSVKLTAREVGHLLKGKLSVGLVNSNDKLKARGPVVGSGSHIVTVSSDEVVTERNFGNYQPAEGPVRGGPFITTGNSSNGLSGDPSRQGIHFSTDATGAIVLVLAPQSIDPNLPSDHPDAEPISARQLAGILNYLGKRDAGVQAAIESLFGDKDPFELFG
ncbi:MAG: DNRLRE domain-containing protein [Planctomycetaceae bacterium]